MENKLNNLYRECIKELNSVGIDVNNNDIIGNIDISISSRSAKRYGCCKHENPDEKYKKVVTKGRTQLIIYEKFNIHHIEISKWVLELNDNIIKNTIMHEIIHCFPFCNNHGKEFKKYAKYINEKLGYDIARLGDKKRDFELSNIEFKEDIKKYKYVLTCLYCGTYTYRMRFNVNMINRYRCTLCGGRLKIEFYK